MAIELATAYVSITAETSKIPKQIDQALQSGARSADSAGRSIGDRMASAMGGALKAGAATAGAAVTAAVGTAAVKGWQRLSAIDDAQGKLTALGHTAGSTAKIMDSALASVKGTSYGLGEAASISASAVAAGIEPGKELTRYLSLIADTATVAGAPLEEIGMLFNQATTKGKVYTLQLNQLAQRGIPIYQYLAKELGVSQEALSKMVREGKVDAEAYRRAIENNIGGAATAATTVSSQWANTMAAMGRLGAAGLKPTFDRLVDWLGGAISTIDVLTPKVGELAKAFDAKMFNDWVPALIKAGRAAKDTFDAFVSSAPVQDHMRRLSNVFSDVWNTAQALWPAVQQIAESLMMASAATGVSSWQLLLTVLESVAPILDVTLVPALQATASIMESNQGAVTALVLAFAAFKTLPMLLGPVRTGVSNLHGALTTARTGIGGFNGAFRDSVTWMRQANPQLSNLGATLRVAGANASAAMGGIRSAASGMVAALGGFATIGITAAIIAIPQLISSAKNWDRQAQISEKAANDVAESQRRMGEAFEKSSGKVDDSVLAQTTRQAEILAQELESLAKSGPGFWDKILAAGRDLPGMFVGGDDKAYQELEAQREVQHQAEETQAALEKLGVGSKELGAALGGTTGEWDNFYRTLFVNSSVSDETLTKLVDMRREVERQQEAARNLTPNISELADHFKTLADSASTADQKSSALKRTLDILAGVPPELGDAMESYNKTLRDVSDNTKEAWDQSKGWSDQLVGQNGAVDTATENGAKLRGFLREIRDNTADVAASGGDLDAALAKNEDSFKNLANAAGLSLDTIKRLAAGEGYDPNRIAMAVQLDGADDVARQFQLIAESLKSFPDKPIEIRADDIGGIDSPTVARLREAGALVEKLDNGNVKITLDANDDAAQIKFGAVMSAIDTLGGVTALPKLDMDKALFDLNAGQAEKMINFLDNLKPSPEADLLIQKLKDGKDLSVTEILDLASKTADPKAYLAGVDKLLGDAKVVSTELDKVARPREATITVTTRNINIAQSAINDTIQRMTAQNRATGGAIYGAGTATSDSIPAYLSNGEHVLTASDVQKAGGQGAIYRLRQAIQAGVARFATGGAVGDALAAARSVDGNKYMLGGTGPTNFDCSGFVGWIQQILMGLGRSTKRLYTTYSLIDGNLAGLEPGLNSSSPFNVGVSQEHMAATLDGHAIESGGAHGTSGIDGGRARAEDSQFPYKFHLPVDLIDDARVLLSGAKASKWTEKDDLDLQSARVAIEQAKEARDKVYANGKKSPADKQQADLRVAKAEEKVRRLEAKRDGEGAVDAIYAEPAPELTGAMTDEELEMRQAEIAVTKAQLQRDQAYADVKSSSLDREEADMAVYSAMNRLESTRKKLDEEKPGGAFNLKDRLQQFGADVVGIAYDSLWKIIGLDEPRWLSVQWPELPAPKVPNSGGQTDPVQSALSGIPSFDQSEVMSQLGFTPGGPNWIEDWMKKLPVKLYDSGGVIPHGGMGLNLSGKPEAVLTNAQMETLTKIADHATLPDRSDDSVDSRGPRMQITNQVTVSNDRSQIRKLQESNKMLLMQYGGAR